MNIIAFDTSGRWMTVAIMIENDVESVQSFSSNKRGSDLLVKKIDMILRFKNIDISEINLIGCVTGPGNFTGLRSGIAVAKSLAFSLSIPIVGLKYFEVFNAERPVTLLRNARKGWWYVSSFDGKAWSCYMQSSDSLNLKGEVISEEEIPGVNVPVVKGPIFSGQDLLESVVRSFQNNLNIYDHISVKPYYLQKPVAQKTVEENL
ncbi:MAG: tRNA (adenosine(37)-N6)-threonylcarbamoyltransferase complex dimerization subunit type 1 TsaB [Mesoaciditoga sp.]|uniref:tRNA (adenosine(37)-N6)-threonylcarbamoyltransferase complex dimerization subunit type 1 TsaB n=1 Tax=Athalassotoga sp. TaxID=2022597 RepID=UPI000CA920C6|nr:MAG: tRNA (adenosine(37)-N6)-threonylcarbamoyltransferase complex dimerization subunit type 1 TsaB [Mesoaciditoga sp.]PMP80588.1 MAG: tRNA (adenosine(37)-N6)-threonylcarbamoyltransferase complex dimerization subunit type 1 TsaB [Mesoaciditoga sp.]HEU23755.1 tRNA (adenosine(37)-N6)-threonylcarbamoyltransferase complex dimerization subunit type 1 TsaB [Mesoaciditoga lauensis]